MTRTTIANQFNRQQSEATKYRALYFLSLRRAGMSNAAIGRAHGISREMVRRLIARAEKMEKAEAIENKQGEDAVE